MYIVVSNNFKGILVKRETTSKLTRNFPETSNSQTSLAKSKDEMAVYSFLVMGLIMGTRYLAIFYAVVLQAERIGLRGKFFLRTFGSPYKIPYCDPETVNL